VYDHRDGPAARPGQLTQHHNLRYLGPMPQTEEGTTRLLEFWQTYYVIMVRNRLSPTQGQLQALTNFGYDPPPARPRHGMRPSGCRSRSSRAPQDQGA